jgi:hypothetical protein
MGEQVALLTPIDLSLGAGHYLEAAVQPAQPVLITVGEFDRDPRPGLGQEHLDPLVVAGEAMLGDQPFMDHRALDGRVGAQPRLHDGDKRADQQRLGARPGRA